MICQIKPIKSRNLKASSIDKAYAEPKADDLPTEVVMWSPHTAGPYLVPVTRWIE
jgi:hypothetical protein